MVSPSDKDVARCKQPGRKLLARLARAAEKSNETFDNPIARNARLCPRVLSQRHKEKPRDGFDPSAGLVSIGCSDSLLTLSSACPSHATQTKRLNPTMPHTQHQQGQDRQAVLAQRRDALVETGVGDRAGIAYTR